MKDENRVYPFCAELSTVWAKNSHLRFGQVIEIVYNRIRKDGRDPFYVDDDAMLQYMREVFNDT